MAMRTPFSMADSFSMTETELYLLFIILSHPLGVKSNPDQPNHCRLMISDCGLGNETNPQSAIAEGRESIWRFLTQTIEWNQA